MPNEVHVWRASLARPAATLAALRSALSEDECARADRFVFARDRNRYIAARGGLRQLLSAYLHMPPNEIKFGYSAFGKPSLVDPPTPSLQFNVSHSGDWALYAFALNRRVGIDIEETQRELDHETIAKSVFSTRECTELAALPAPQQRLAFYNTWTRKEAFIKAVGEGLSYALDSFSVSVRPDAPVSLTLPDAAAEAQWKLYPLTPTPDTAGALVVEGGAAGLRLYAQQ